MSDQHTANTDAHPLDGVPGCGVAAYGIVLIVFFIVGLLGMGLSSAALLQASSSGKATSRLYNGNDVVVWKLQPMRDAGVLHLTEVPIVWHDESAAENGSEACAMTEDAIVRVEDATGYEIAYADIDHVDATVEGEITIVEAYHTDGSALRCFFRANEGGEKMARMVRSEAGLVGSYRGDN